jgi:hypothetical protein
LGYGNMYVSIDNWIDLTKKKKDNWIGIPYSYGRMLYPP